MNYILNYRLNICIYILHININNNTYKCKRTFIIIVNHLKNQHVFLSLPILEKLTSNLGVLHIYNLN